MDELAYGCGGPESRLEGKTMKVAFQNTVIQFKPRYSAPPAPLDTTQTFHVYVMASGPRGRLAVSMAQDIATRVRNQKNDLHPRDYTSVNGIHTLVHVEECHDVCEAMDRYNALREMDAESLSHLIDAENPDWQDLYADYAP